MAISEGEAEFIARHTEILEKADPVYADGQNPEGWLAIEPTISDQQLDCFVELLDSIKEECLVRGGATLFAHVPLSLVPPNAVLVMLKELQMYRTIDKLQGVMGAVEVRSES
jgi:hypothetical protein